MKLPYIQLHPDDPYRPIAPIILRNGDAVVGGYGLIDSGADRSIFDTEYANQLGIASIESGRKIGFTGVSGKPFIGYLHTRAIARQAA